VADNKIAESPQKITIVNNEQTTQKSSKYGTIMVYEIYEKATPEVKGGSIGENKIIAPTKLPQTPFDPEIVGV